MFFIMAAICLSVMGIDIYEYVKYDKVSIKSCLFVWIMLFICAVFFSIASYIFMVWEDCHRIQTWDMWSSAMAAAYWAMPSQWSRLKRQYGTTGDMWVSSTNGNKGDFSLIFFKIIVLLQHLPQYFAWAHLPILCEAQCPAYFDWNACLLTLCYFSTECCLTICNQKDKFSYNL